MKHACLVPASHSDDLTGAMATLLRTGGVSLDGDDEVVEQRAFDALYDPAQRFTYGEIKPRLGAAIARARDLGVIDLAGAPR
jgi:hypothetical protein